MTEQPMLLEVFTDSDNESAALQAINTIAKDKKMTMKNKTKKLLGEKRIRAINKVLKR